MIIDDEYIQYEEFRIINKASVDAISLFEKELNEAEGSADPEASKAACLKKWEDQAAYDKAHEESTEESVYAVTYSGKLKELWEGHFKTC